MSSILYNYFLNPACKMAGAEIHRSFKWQSLRKFLHKNAEHIICFKTEQCKYSRKSWLLRKRRTPASSRKYFYSNICLAQFQNKCYAQRSAPV